MQQPDRITTEEVMRRINRHEKLMFIDARTRQSFERSEEIISHAMRVPPDDVAACSGRIPKSPLIVYCDSPHEQTSMEVARELRARGFRVLGVLAGGLEAWKAKRGFMVSKPAGEDLQVEHYLTHSQPTPPPRRNVPDYVPSEGVTAGTEPVSPTERVYSPHHRPSHP